MSGRLISDKRKAELELMKTQLDILSSNIQKVIDGKSSMGELAKSLDIYPQKLNDAINMLNINYQNYIKRYVLNEWYFI